MAEQRVYLMQQEGLEYYTQLKLKHINNALKSHETVFAIQEYRRLARVHEQHGNVTNAHRFSENARKIRANWEPYKRLVKADLKRLSMLAKQEHDAIESGNASLARKIFYEMQGIAYRTSESKIMTEFRKYTRGFNKHIQKVMKTNYGYDTRRNLVKNLRRRTVKSPQERRPFVAFDIPPSMDAGM